MIRIQDLFITCVVLLVCFASAVAQETPNFVLIMTDDQGYGDLGSYGSSHIRTPRIARMATEGIRFTDFYAQPFCGPSRAALMTGSYAPRNLLMFNHVPRVKTGIHADEVALGEVLQQADYATAMFGKWHLGDAQEFRPVNNGFDQYLGLLYSNDMCPNHPKVKRTPNDGPVKREIRRRAEYTGCQGEGQIYPLDWFPDLPLVRNLDAIELNPDQTQLTRRYTEGALEFIEANRDRPFFLYLAHSMPHVPLFRNKKFEGVSQRGLYGDVIEELDVSTDRVLDKREELGLDDNTLVVFTSDNGPWLHYGIDSGSAGPLRDGKGTVWERGLRVPAIMRWPGKIPEGQVTSEIGSNIDILPTFAGLAGAELPSKHVIDGKDLWPLISVRGGKSPRETFLYYEGQIFYRAEDGAPVNEPILRGICEGRWKVFLESPEVDVDGPALYDLYADVGEVNNVADRHADVVKRLSKLARENDRELMSQIRPLGRVAE
jgi:arylsulfatase A